MSSPINYFPAQYSALLAGHKLTCKTKAEQIKSVKSDLFFLDYSYFASENTGH